jgi:hypothetical protein
MPRSPKSEATQRLIVAARNHTAALAAATRTKGLYHRAIVAASAAGIPKVEIARLIGTSDTRVHQIIRGEEK